MTVAVLVGVSEGNNAYRMVPFASPWYGPLGFAVLTVVGAALAGPSRGRSAGVGHTGDAEPAEPHPQVMPNVRPLIFAALGRNAEPVTLTAHVHNVGVS